MGGPAGAFTVTRGDTRASRRPQGLCHNTNSPFRQVLRFLHPSGRWRRQETRRKRQRAKFPCPRPPAVFPFFRVGELIWAFIPAASRTAPRNKGRELNCCCGGTCECECARESVCVCGNKSLPQNTSKDTSIPFPPSGA